MFHSEDYRCVRHGFPTFAKNQLSPTRAERAVQTPIAPQSQHPIEWAALFAADSRDKAYSKVK